MPSITRCLQTPRKGRQASRGAYRMPANKYCRQTAWRQILTACLTCICPHWRGNISRKSVWGPAAKHRVTVGSLVACNRKMFTLFAGRAGPQLSVWFRHKCLPLWAPGIHAEHHCHRITQQTSSIVFCFAYPERTTVFFKPSSEYEWEQRSQHFWALDSLEAENCLLPPTCPWPR